MNLETNPYVQDILSQADALQNALARFDITPLKPITSIVRRGGFDRIVLTGMGASFYAAYPIWLRLVQAGLPAYWLDASELIHHARPLLTGKTLLWVFSQSGRSAEIIALLKQYEQDRMTLLATVNDLSSPLARTAGDFVIPLWAQPEQSVSTRTYLNTLALSQLAALVLTDDDAQIGIQQLHATAAAVFEYLADWKKHLQEIRSQIKLTRNLVLLGRGYSLAAVYTGALILGEAAKVGAIGLQAGEFRHGPLELAGPELTALLFAGPLETQPLMARLHYDLLQIGARSIWVAPLNSPSLKPQIPMPDETGIGAPLAEILPIQLLTLHLAAELGVEAGKFLHIGKVTLSE
jgi:glucosamine--fructose-6-phosphate aminotransferase (isomerizing)